MKVIYPGPGVTGWAKDFPTLHPDFGILVLGENEMDDALAQRLINAGLVAAPEVKRAKAKPPPKTEEDLEAGPPEAVTREE
jgi:hypothetical protein